MIKTDEKHYDFVSKALPEDTFTVVSFTGREALSDPYEFDILLASEKTDVDSTELLKNRASLVIHRGDGDLVYHGRPISFEQGREAHGLVLYRVLLAPFFVLLHHFQAQQIFLDMTAPQIIEDVLEKAGLGPDDYALKLKETYPVREYVCQYEETHFDFISRLMEENGLYYFFEQNQDREKLIITDTALVHEKRAGVEDLIYSQVSGLDALHKEEVVHDFGCRVSRIPKKVTVSDYYYERPSLKPEGEADVSREGHGQIYLYGLKAASPEEGRAAARLKAEELIAGSRIFEGRSGNPAISAGYINKLSKHPRSDFNADYLVIGVEHQGRHTGPLISGLSGETDDDGRLPSYENRFRAVPSTIQYRARRKTPRPRAAGVVAAHVDSEGAGEYAELDSQGRYKIRPVFDVSDRPDGLASHWVRMAQPFGGKGGLHFPLHKGTEIILTHMDGDPDRPVIASALPNPENESPVSSGNQTRSVMRSATHNRIEFDDKKDSEGIMLAVPNNSSVMVLGMTQDEWDLMMKAIGEALKEAGEAIGDLAKSIWDANKGGTGWQPIKNNHDGFALSTNSSWGKYVGQDLKIKVGGNSISLLLGSETAVVLGFSNRTVILLCSEIVLGGRIEATVPEKWQWTNVKSKTEEERLELIQEKLDAVNEKIQALDQKLIAATNTADALNDHNRLAAEKVELINDKIRAINTDTRAIESKIAATDEVVRAINTKMELTEAKIVDAEMMIDAANVKAGEVDCVIEKAGSKIEAVAALHEEAKELSVRQGEEVNL